MVADGDGGDDDENVGIGCIVQFGHVRHTAHL